MLALGRPACALDSYVATRDRFGLIVLAVGPPDMIDAAVAR